jgi:peroxiredoxin
MRIRRAKALYFVILGGAMFVGSRSTGATITAALKTPHSRTAAPAFSLSDVSGKTRAITEYRGQVVLLNFWATECGGCRLEIPWIVDLQHAFQNKKVAFVGVSLDVSYENLKNATEAWAKVKPFLKTHQITYPILMGDDEVTKNYGIQALPVTLLIDTQGRIAATYTGLLNERNAETNINALLSEHR